MTILAVRFITMKYTLSIFLLSCTLCLNAQKITRLSYTDPAHVVNPGKAIIYGSFIPRKQKAMQKGLQHYIRIQNDDTKEIFSIEVVPYSSTTKENIFCYVIAPGTYKIIDYKWADEVVFGAKIHTEPVFKNIDATDSLSAKINTGAIETNDAKYYQFTVQADKVYYLGRWNFASEVVSFSNEKQLTDKKIKKDFLTLDFDRAITILPQ